MSNELRASVLKYVIDIDDALREGLRAFGLYIHGVEVTQAIQYWRAADHLTDPADRGPDNSIPLVADKPAYVRVYVRRRGTSLAGVIGTVTVQRQRYGIWVDMGGALTPQPPASVTAQSAPTYATERGSLNSSLNFLIPASTMRGRMQLKVHVEVPGTQYRADTELEINASLLQTLRMRGIPVRYWGPDAAGNQVQLAAPTLADFQSTAAAALLMFPVSQTPDIGLAGTFTWSNPLTGNITTSGGSSSCPTSWTDLLFWLGIAKIIDGNRADRLYYALLPSGIPTGNPGGGGGVGAGGCGGGGAVGAGFINASQTMAHELGHVLGLSHAPGCLVTGDMGDPNYPAYEPYDTANNKQASIGEYGLDPTTHTVYPPNVARDLMSYCGPRWISPYHYRALIQHALLDPQWVTAARNSLPPYFEERFRDPIPHHIPDPPPPWVGRRVHELAEPAPVPLVIVTGLLRNDMLEIRSVLRVQTGPTAVGQRITGTTVELLDEQGQVIDRAPLLRVALHATCGCSEGESGPPSGLVQALLPDDERIGAIRVMRGENELWSRRATTESPRIGEVSAELDDDNLRVRWQTSAADENPTERVVRWSADNGHTWQALAVALPEDEALVSLTMLTSGVAIVQVLVSDGFYTVAAEPVRVEIPPRPPHIAILWPAQGSAVKIDNLVRLWGMATASDSRTLPGDALRWELDGEPVGNGTEVWTYLPEWEGEHRATLRVLDGNQASESSVTFFATCSGRRPVQLDRD